MSFYNSIEQELALLSNSGNLRKLRTMSCDNAQAKIADNLLWNFSSNDYLGIAGDSELRQKFYASLADATASKWQLSAASSRLLTGNSVEYEELELALSHWYGVGRGALVFNSGYHANVGMLSALSRKGDVVLSDKLNHASIIDGMRLCEAECRRYRHLDYNHLEMMLKQTNSSKQRVFIITESIFSMDGDSADLKTLVELKERYGAILIVDEAHSVGVFGSEGRGYAEAQGVADAVDVIIGTFGKAFGSTGAYGIMSTVLRDYLINKMRTLIFTTGLPPVVLAWSRFILEQMDTMQWRRDRVLSMAERLRKVIESKGYATGGASQIVPLIVGDNFASVELAEKLRSGNILSFAIRPPTVPVGSSRLRFSLSATLPDEALNELEALL